MSGGTVIQLQFVQCMSLFLASGHRPLADSFHKISYPNTSVGGEKADALSVQFGCRLVTPEAVILRREAHSFRCRAFQCLSRLTIS